MDANATCGGAHGDLYNIRQVHQTHPKYAGDNEARKLRVFVHMTENSFRVDHLPLVEYDGDRTRPPAHSSNMVQGLAW